jgi:heme/copper-type cytochrome/quinol oxidase subunit 4
MSLRRFSLRAFVLAWILAVALALLPLATVLADGGPTIYPH